MPSKYIFHEHNFGGYHWLITKKIGHVLFLSIDFFPFYFINIYQQLNSTRKQKPIVWVYNFFYSDCISTTDLSFHGQVLS